MGSVEKTSNQQSNELYSAAVLDPTPALLESGELIEGPVGEFGESSQQYQSSGAQSSNSGTLSRPNFRLLVVSSSVLALGAMAVVEDHDVVSIGRDRHTGPNVRLKEMAVSKYHAYIFWDRQTSVWAIVDVGSVHGTYLHRDKGIAPVSGSVVGSQSRIRLSAQRSASPPVTLIHLDHVIIGSTTFIVHIHTPEGLCELCTIGQDVITLDPPKVGPNSLESSPTHDRSITYTQDHKKALKDLKCTLFERTRHSSVPKQAASTTSTPYINRSARRREAIGLAAYSPSSRPEPSFQDRRDARRASVRSILDPRLQDVFSDTSTPEAKPSNENRRTSPVAVPISASNIGHRLLVKSGWTPGQALGSVGSVGLIQPLEVRSFEHRAGLGSHSLGHGDSRGG